VTRGGPLKRERGVLPYEQDDRRECRASARGTWVHDGKRLAVSYCCCAGKHYPQGLWGCQFRVVVATLENEKTAW